MTPDATCNYVQAGEHNGRDYARRLDGAYFIWWDGVDTWLITTTLGVKAAPLWNRVDPNIEGDYPAGAGAVGLATVTKGEH